MHTLIIDQEVNTHTPPTPQPTLQHATEITIGDLHGNAANLIYFLLREGICKLSDENYLSFMYHYYRVPYSSFFPTKKFKDIIESLTIERTDVLIRLIGDEVADRGANDSIFLLILKKLSKSRVPIEILLSNHGYEFIHFYERDGFRMPDQPWQYNIFELQRISLMRLFHSVTLGDIPLETVEKIINKYYKPALKLLSYSINEEENRIYLYTHAPIDLRVVEHLANQLIIPYRDETIRALADTIDRLNEKFSALVIANKVHTLDTFREEDIDTGYYIDNPIMDLMWNRDYQKINRVPVHKGYFVYYVHGHDSCGESNEFTANLDNCLGKQPHGLDWIPEGEYKALATTCLLSKDLYCRGAAPPSTSPKVREAPYSRFFIVDIPLPKKSKKENWDEALHLNVLFGE